METITNNTNDIPRFREAFARVQDKIAAVPDSELPTINVDIVAASTMVMGVLSGIVALRDRFVQELPTFDIKLLDDLETYTLACTHAHIEHLAASTPPESVPALADEAARTRDLLYSDVSAAAKRGLISGEKLNALKGTNGHRNIATDVLTLAGILRSNWSKLDGKCAITLAELDHAESLSYRLLHALGVREQSAPAVAQAAQTRLRAYALFASRYNQVRRGVHYLRWDHDDAEEIAPSLYTGRGGRRKTSGDTSAEVGSVAAGAHPPAEVSANANASSPPATASLAAAASTPRIPVGMPGSDPFGN
jgi:hypothetical protein